MYKLIVNDEKEKQYLELNDLISELKLTENRSLEESIDILFHFFIYKKIKSKNFVIKLEVNDFISYKEDVEDIIFQVPYWTINNEKLLKKIWKKYVKFIKRMRI